MAEGGKKSSQLNSYLFAQIFDKCIDLDSQLKLLEAFPEFKEDAVREWRRSMPTNILGNSLFLTILERNKAYYPRFMKWMQPQFKFLIVVRIHAKYGLTKFFGKLKELNLGMDVFPGIKECILTGLAYSEVDEEINRLTKMIPNITELYVNMGSTGLHFDKFKYLKNLCYYTPFVNVPTQSTAIENIYLTLKNLRTLDLRGGGLKNVNTIHINLPNLEELIIQPSAFIDLFDTVVALPRLRKLTVHYPNPRIVTFKDYHFGRILQAKAKNLTSLEINNKLIRLDKNWDAEIGILTFPKLRKLAFDHWKFHNAFLNGHNVDRTKIEQLYFNHWKRLSKGRLLNIVMAHPSLKELSVWGSQFERTTLPQIESMLKEANDSFEKYQNTSSANILKYSKPRPKLFIWGFCEKWRRLNQKEVSYWENSKYIDIEINRCAGYPYQKKGYVLEFDSLEDIARQESQ